MTTHLLARTQVALATLSALAGTLLVVPAWAQNFPITAENRAVANEVAQKGVPLSEISADAPDRYTIKRGDTLWAISSMYLKSPWRWPELWGMNLNEIKNPHLIYPGQVLILERKNGVATLRVEGGAAGPAAAPSDQPNNTVRVSPRTRYESLGDAALPTLRSSVIEPFLAEPVIVDEGEFKNAPRIVATQQGRVLLTRGDRAYARGPSGSPMLDDQAGEKMYRVFRTATPLKDPVTGEVLGFEAVYVGKAKLMRSEGTSEVQEANGKTTTAIVPATIDIVAAKEEMREGDRLLPEPPRQLQTFNPRAPDSKMTARIVSVYGNAVANAGQNQVVTINRGKLDGMEPGHVMAILKDGARAIDKQDSSRPLMKLPDERNGLLMVFRTFDRLSYALVLEITDGVQVGDRLISPRR
ncbi:MAG: LysM peptidoglycan-binding domain-containing protein [Rhodoferax sp.]|nr:LysM peptidoglycan-binding domain-containing protein [Rhodoferax sp.]